MAADALSVVVPTRNEEANIGACLDAFRGLETVVVDNFSADRTFEIAVERGAKALRRGPERCAQRNCGWRATSGRYVMFVDADMIVPRETLDEILALIAADDGSTAFYVREERVGGGLRLRARNFERSFYDGTAIDGLRVVPRKFLEATGGYDEALVACEDWDLDRRLVAAGARTRVTKGALLHNEARQGLKRFLAKKAYYAKSVDAYRRKWGADETCRKQFGLLYRYFGVFTEHGKWRRLVAHPILAAVMFFERIAVGAVYLLKG